MRRGNKFVFVLKTVMLLKLLLLWSSWKHCGAQVDAEEADEPPGESTDDRGGHGDAFFALRSCHQLLRGDSGEFFSPDYLCSNPSLWCNWTIRVDPGKRVHLQLEDLTPDDACHLKQDQVHVDEPGSRFGVHEILQKCWREAKYTTTTNTVNVVLLIGSRPNSPYRGFYSRYQAFGPPVMYSPQEVFTERDERSEPGLDVADFGPVTNSDADFDATYDYYESVETDEQPWESEDGADADAEVGEDLHPPPRWNISQVFPITAVPTLPVSTPGTSRSERSLPHTGQTAQSNRLDSDRPSHQLQASTRPPVAVRRNVIVEEEEEEEEDEDEDEDEDEEELTAADDNNNSTEVHETSDQHPSTSEEPEPEPDGTEDAHPHPNAVEPLLDDRRSSDERNHSELPHLPAGCSSGLSAEAKGVYVLFFLLSFLILTLLAAAAVLYHRHHRGNFLVRCHSSGRMSPPDLDGHRCDGYSRRADVAAPPPPPRGSSRESWPQVKELCPAVDLPLLRFSPLQPPDGYMEPRDGGNL